MNSHFVSRTLTKPWEHGNRRLRVLEVGTGKVKFFPSKKRFAQEGLYSEALERVFDEHVENDFAEIRDAIVEGRLSKVPSSEELQRLFEYIKKMMLLTVFRTYDVQDTRGYLESPLENLKENPETYFNHATSEWFRCHPHAFFAPTEPWRPFFFPRLGFFRVPMPLSMDPRPISWALATPIHPTLAAVFMPAEGDTEMLVKSIRESPLLDAASMGSPVPNDELIIPPALETTDDVAIINHVRNCKAHMALIAEELPRLDTIFRDAVRGP